VTQQVVRELDISLEKLTKERLEADPSSSDATSNDDSCGHVTGLEVWE
jgi:hypothetical protein